MPRPVERLEFRGPVDGRAGTTHHQRHHGLRYLTCGADGRWIQRRMRRYEVPPRRHNAEDMTARAGRLQKGEYLQPPQAEREAQKVVGEGLHELRADW